MYVERKFNSNVLLNKKGMKNIKETGMPTKIDFANISVFS